MPSAKYQKAQMYLSSEREQRPPVRFEERGLDPKFVKAWMQTIAKAVSRSGAKLSEIARGLENLFKLKLR